MGYDLHITRAKDWSQNVESQISAEEWLAYVERDPELSLFPENGPHCTRWAGKSQYPDPWLNWFRGNVYTKNPDEALIEKMVAIAHELDAQVQGDDGEIYHSGHEPPTDPKLPWRDRLHHWLQALRPAQAIEPIAPPFAVGDRVVDVGRREATVLEIDPKASHGLGKVKVRYDGGQEITYALAASGLAPIAKKG